MLLAVILTLILKHVLSEGEEQRDGECDPQDMQMPKQSWTPFPAPPPTQGPDPSLQLTPY